MGLIQHLRDAVKAKRQGKPVIRDPLLTLDLGQVSLSAAARQISSQIGGAERVFFQGTKNHGYFPWDPDLRGEALGVDEVISYAVRAAEDLAVPLVSARFSEVVHPGGRRGYVL